MSAASGSDFHVVFFRADDGGLDMGGTRWSDDDEGFGCGRGRETWVLY